MELKSNLRLLRYIQKLLLGQTQNLLPYPIAVQKPCKKGKTPTPILRSTAEKQGIPRKMIQTFLDEISSISNAPHTCLMSCNGSVICEASWAPYTLSEWHVTHSLAKTFVATAIGILHYNQKLKLTDTICEIFPEKCTLLTSKRMRMVTIEHLLTMTSGVNCREASIFCHADWLKIFLESDFSFSPGEKFQYNSINTYILSSIVQRKTGKRVSEYLAETLFFPLGFGDVAFEQCPCGVDKGGWGMYLYLEDAMKLGQLYLQNGIWYTANGAQRILSEEWVQKATTAYFSTEHGQEYGYQLWIDSKQKLYLLNGMFGQYIVVVPDLFMVIGLNSGAENLFINSSTYHALLRFIENLRKYQKQYHHPTNFFKTSRFSVPIWSTVPNKYQQKPLLLKKLLPSLYPEKFQKIFLHNRKFVFPENKVTFFPKLLGCMNDIYLDGVKSIHFFKAKEDIAHIMCWKSKNNNFYIPFSFQKQKKFLLNLQGNIFTTVSSASLRYDEDLRPVLKITLYFIETTSTASIKLFLPQKNSSQVLLCMEESPGLLTIFDSFRESNDLVKQIDSIFTDIDYLKYRIKRFACPLVHGQEISLKNH